MISWNVDFEGKEDIYKLLTGAVDEEDVQEI